MVCKSWIQFIFHKIMIHDDILMFLSYLYNEQLQICGSEDIFTTQARQGI